MKKRNYIAVFIILVFVVTVLMFLQGYDRFLYVDVSGKNGYELEKKYCIQNNVNFQQLNKDNKFESINEQYYVLEYKTILSLDNSIDSLTFYNNNLSNVFEIENLGEEVENKAYVFEKYKSLVNKTFKYNNKEYTIAGIIKRNNQFEDKIGYYDTLFINDTTTDYSYKSCLLTNDELKYCIEKNITLNKKIGPSIINNKFNSALLNTLTVFSFPGFYNTEIVNSFIGNELVCEIIGIFTSLIMYIILILSTYYIIRVSGAKIFNNNDKIKLYLKILVISVVISLSSFILSTLILRLSINLATNVEISFNTGAFIIPYILLIFIVTSISYYLINKKTLKNANSNI